MVRWIETVIPRFKIAGITVFFMLTISCGESTPIYSYDNFLKDSLSIPYQNSPTFSFTHHGLYDTKSNVDYSVVLDQRNGEVYWFDLEKEEIATKTHLPENFKGKDISLYPAKENRLYVLLEKDFRIYLLDKTGSVLKQWNLFPILEKAMDAAPYRLESTLRHPFHISNQQIICFAYEDAGKMKENKRKKYYGRNFDYLIDLETAKARRLPTVFPHNWLTSRLKYAEPQRYFGKNDLLIYSPAYTDTCYTYNLASRKTKVIRTSNSSFDPNFRFDTTKFFDFSYVRKYLTENDRFINMYYDPYRKLYYRGLSHGVKENSENLLFLDNEFSLGVYDENFNLLREVIFPPNTYDLTKIIIGKAGVYINKDEVLRKTNPDLKSVNYGLFRFDQ